MTELKFWKPQPRPVFQDWRTYSLLIPIICAAIGGAAFSVFTFAFDSIDVWTPLAQDRLIVFAAVCMAIGAELGTPGTITEVYRKVKRGEQTTWDWVALAVSLLATLIAVGTAFARRIGGGASWAPFVVEWGPAIVVIFVALDTYGAYIELGALIGSYEQRMEQWLAERDAFVQAQNTTSKPPDDMLTKLGERIGALTAQFSPLAQQVTALAEDVTALKKATWPKASKADFDRILARLNGDRHTLDEQRLAVELACDELRMPSDTTVRRWLDGLDNGEH